VVRRRITVTARVGLAKSCISTIFSSFSRKSLRPLATLPLLVGPGERDDDAVASPLDTVKAVAPITELLSR
jgi:hypothetical protein